MILSSISRVAGLGRSGRPVALAAIAAFGLHSAANAGNNCCTPSGNPGCTDPVCEKEICLILPSCCDTAWESDCVDFALLFCGDCETPPLECPPGTIEASDGCALDDPDSNGGCNVDEAFPPYDALGTLTPGSPTVEYCGSVGTLPPDSRDLDWTTITLNEPAFISVSVDHTVVATGLPAPNFVIIVRQGSACATAETVYAVASGANPFVTPSIPLPAGTHTIIFTVNAFGDEGPLCPVSYVATISATFGGFQSCVVGGDTNLTQSNSTTPGAGQIACAGGGITTANQFARSFNLGVGATAGEDYLLKCVEFGVSNTGSPVNANLNVYIDTNGGPPTSPTTDLTLLSTEPLTIDTSIGVTRVVTFATPLCIPANSFLVMELDIAASTDGFAVIAGNTAGQTAPTYIRATGCGFANFVTLASLGFPDGNWTLRLIGDTGCGVEPTPCPADLNGDGAVTSADLGLMLLQFGGPGTGDLNDDGVVNGGDVGLLLLQFGDCPK